jgi:hypothetical protein
MQLVSNDSSWENHADSQTGYPNLRGAVLARDRIFPIFVAKLEGCSQYRIVKHQFELVAQAYGADDEGTFSGCAVARQRISSTGLTRAPISSWAVKNATCSGP